MATAHPGGGDAPAGRTVTIDFGGADGAVDVAVTDNGRVVVLARVDGNVAVARFKSDGRLDRSFSGDGKVVTALPLAAHAGALAVQRDGKVVVATGGPLLRFTRSGELDRSFSGDGVVPDDGAYGDVIVLRDGGIVTLGLNLKIYTSVGALVAERDVNGGGSGYRLVARQASGHFVLAGASDMATAVIDRFTEGLTRDIGDPGDPIGIAAIGLSVLPDDAFLVVSADYWEGDARGSHLFNRPGLALERYLPDGSRDATFGDNGAVVVNGSTWPNAAESTSFAISAARDGRGVVTVLGNGWLARLTDRGVLDTSFSGDGILTLSGPAAALAVDRNDVVLAGTSGDDVIVRWLEPRRIRR